MRNHASIMQGREPFIECFLNAFKWDHANKCHHCMPISSTTLVMFQYRDKSEKSLGVSALSSLLLPHIQLKTITSTFRRRQHKNVTKFVSCVETSQNSCPALKHQSFQATHSYAVTTATIHAQKHLGTVFSPIQSVLSSWLVWKAWEKRDRQMLLVHCVTCCWQMPSKLLCATTGECTVVKIDIDLVNSRL